MPLVHVVTTVAIVALCIRACFSTRSLFAGRARPRSTPEYLAMIVVCLLVVWQASIWLGGEHPEAGTGFRIAVWIQLVSAGLIASLTAGSLVWAKTGGGARRAGIRPGQR